MSILQLHLQSSMPVALTRYKSVIRSGNFAQLLPETIPPGTPGTPGQCPFVEVHSSSSSPQFECSYVFFFLRYLVIFSFSNEKKGGLKCSVIVENTPETHAPELPPHLVHTLPSKDQIKSLFAISILSLPVTPNLEQKESKYTGNIIQFEVKPEGHKYLEYILAEYNRDARAVVRNLDRELPAGWATMAHIDTVCDLPDHMLKSLASSIVRPTGISTAAFTENQPPPGSWHRTINIRLANMTRRATLVWPKESNLLKTTESCKWQLTPLASIEPGKASLCCVATDSAMNTHECQLTYSFNVPDSCLFGMLVIKIEQAALGKISVNAEISLNSVFSSDSLKLIRQSAPEIQPQSTSDAARQDMSRAYSKAMRDRFACQITRLDQIKGQLHIAFMDHQELPPIELVEMKILRPRAYEYAAIYESNSTKYAGLPAFEASIKDNNPTAEWRIGSRQIRISNIPDAVEELNTGIDILDQVLSILGDEFNAHGCASPYINEIEREFFGPEIFDDLYRAHFKRISLPSWQSILSSSEVILSVNAVDNIAEQGHRGPLLPPDGDSAIREVEAQFVNETLHPDVTKQRSLEVSALTEVLYGHIISKADLGRRKTQGREQVKTSRVAEAWAGIQAERCPILVTWNHGGERLRKVFSPNEVVNMIDEVTGGFKDVNILLGAEDKPYPIPRIYPIMLDLDLRAMWGRPAPLNRILPSSFVTSQLYAILLAIDQPLQAIIEWHIRTGMAAERAISIGAYARLSDTGRRTAVYGQSELSPSDAPEFPPGQSRIPMSWLQVLAKLTPGVGAHIWPSQAAFRSTMSASPGRSIGTDSLAFSSERGRQVVILPTYTRLDLQGVILVLREASDIFLPMVFGKRRKEYDCFPDTMSWVYNKLINREEFDLEDPHDRGKIQQFVYGSLVFFRHLHREMYLSALSSSMTLVSVLDQEFWRSLRKSFGHCIDPLDANPSNSPMTHF